LKRRNQSENGSIWGAGGDTKRSPNFGVRADGGQWTVGKEKEMEGVILKNIEASND